MIFKVTSLLKFSFFTGVLACNTLVLAQKPKPAPEPVAFKEGKLVYHPNEKGDRIPDFSFAGYKAGEEAIPTVHVKVFVPFKQGDATLRIQSAIDYVSSLPVDKNGFRGAVLLDKGLFSVGGSLKINASGVVLRGSGAGENGTTILGTGLSRETLISVAGEADKRNSTEQKIAEAYVPVNAMKVSVVNVNGLKVGDYIQIRRPSTQTWIDKLGAGHFGGGETYLGWKPGQRDIFWDRRVTAINGSTISFDAPLTNALDTAFGGGFIAKYTWAGRINNIGIENLQLKSAYNPANLKDEDHRWMAISFENVVDAWVRQTEFRHFAGSAVFVQESAKRITVEDCKSLEPVSEIGGQRRYTFITEGQQTLFQRLYAEGGYHDFAVGYRAPGPNAFVQCESRLPYSFSGTIDSWASGVLFDIVNVDGQALSYSNRWLAGQGAGWTAANSVFWQCSASRVDNYAPPTAQNWAFGTWAQFFGDGYWAMSNEHIRPRSLYYAQLQDRLGDKVQSRIQLLTMDTEASSSPSVDVAMALTAKAAKPLPILSDFIDQAASRNPITISTKGVKTIDQIGLRKITTSGKAGEFKVQNGLLVRDNTLITGKRRDIRWWSGSSRPHGLAGATPHVTRFVPGKTGRGLTDDLETMSDSMKLNNIVALEHNYGLWYDRRRDDHERVRRMDGEVWPPFYEQPFARSGQGTAWDGLSKYDLTKYNNWYWNRLKEFANLADQKGLVLIHENYFQHNIIEAGAHYADFPWRPANNINNTGFPEPVPYAGDKRIFMAEQFYDISHPARRELHKAYIRKCLDNFAANSGVIQSISAEYTGPLHFVQFWLDVIKEWEREKGKNALVSLSTTKDVQDAILADKDRASVVDMIDIKYWHYQADGSAYEPKGGQNLAPRQHARLLKPKKSSFEQVYRAVREYRDKYPEKAVLYSADNSEEFALASFLAGGSLAAVADLPKRMLQQATDMEPVKDKNGVMGLGNKENAIIYNPGADSLPVDFSQTSGTFNLSWVDLRTGAIVKEDRNKSGKDIIHFKKPQGGNLILWVSKN
ncbi:DUF6298 domain-containing protein [Paradesertivirga mongoliensis]|uniref:DUF6298 domain-containing protein n=1 Tax=Paradesertivirga mongoliensis TaxID=2100740 RepID=A0ABW4ZQJ3_9SPHI|nr:DUF6298 domain-containing protein [Pedobacter mongoliensis]